jgi:hypothetical protein
MAQRTGAVPGAQPAGAAAAPSHRHRAPTHDHDLPARAVVGQVGGARGGRALGCRDIARRAVGAPGAGGGSGGSGGLQSGAAGLLATGPGESRVHQRGSRERAHLGRRCAGGAPGDCGINKAGSARRESREGDRKSAAMPRTRNPGRHEAGSAPGLAGGTCAGVPVTDERADRAGTSVGWAAAMWHLRPASEASSWRAVCVCRSCGRCNCGSGGARCLFQPAHVQHFCRE